MSTCTTLLITKKKKKKKKKDKKKERNAMLNTNFLKQDQNTRKVGKKSYFDQTIQNMSTLILSEDAFFAGTELTDTTLTNYDGNEIGSS